MRTGFCSVFFTLDIYLDTFEVGFEQKTLSKAVVTPRHHLTNRGLLNSPVHPPHHVLHFKRRNDNVLKVTNQE